LTVHQVDTAIDCGTYVNPDGSSPARRRSHYGLSLANMARSPQGRPRAAGNFDGFPVIAWTSRRSYQVHIVPPAADTPPSESASPEYTVCTGTGQRIFARDRQAHPRAAVGQATRDLITARV